MRAAHSTDNVVRRAGIVEQQTTIVKLDGKFQKYMAWIDANMKQSKKLRYMQVTSIGFYTSGRLPVALSRKSESFLIYFTS
jgi:hypothetical protein